MPMGQDRKKQGPAEKREAVRWLGTWLPRGPASVSLTLGRGLGDAEEEGSSARGDAEMAPAQGCGRPGWHPPEQHVPVGGWGGGGGRGAATKSPGTFLPVFP